MKKKRKKRTSWDLELRIYNMVLKDVLQSASEDRVEETEASYPNYGTVKDSRESGPNASEEVIEEVGDGGLKLQVGAPLPKDLGHVIGHLWGISSSLEPVCRYQVLMDLLSIWSKLQGVPYPPLASCLGAGPCWP